MRERSSTSAPPSGALIAGPTPAPHCGRRSTSPSAAACDCSPIAADGHSNREIAEELYVTRRTVETHLTHVFQKLDIRARAELPAALAGRDTEGRAHALA